MNPAPDSHGAAQGVVAPSVKVSPAVVGRSSGSILKRLRGMPQAPVEVALTMATGALIYALFIWRSGILALDLRTPITYGGDSLLYGNFVFNAQLGDVFKGLSLGAPGGQQMGWSAWGVEWFQSWVVGHLASGADGPWMAMARYWQFAYFAAGVTAYLALRWLRAGRIPAIVGAVAFALVPQTENPTEFILTSIFTLPLVLAVGIRLTSGSSFADLVPTRRPVKGRHRTLLGVCLTATCGLVAMFGANYYQIFNLLMVVTLGVTMATRRRWWPRAKRLGLVAGFCAIPTIIGISGVMIHRLSAGLGLSEPALSDRRAYAAYANGGDPFALLLPLRDGFLNMALRAVVTPFGDFYSEWNHALITGEEYITFLGGVAVFLAVILLVLGLLGAYRRQDFLRRVSPMRAVVKATLLAWALATLWYSRGGLGTFLSFVLPQVRGYARASTIVGICAIAFLALIATRALRNPGVIRRVALVCLCLAAVDSVVATVSVKQVDASANYQVIDVPRRDLDVPVVGGYGLSVRSLGLKGTKDIVVSAESKFAPGCTVLVLPLMHYPADFDIGLISYYSYEVIKPGLVASTLKWTAGGLPGTPDNRFTDKWLAQYRVGEYGPILQAADEAGYCGALYFSSLQQGFFVAGPLNGSAYTKNAATVAAALEQHYGKPCDAVAGAEVFLFCRKS